MSANIANGILYTRQKGNNSCGTRRVGGNVMEDWADKALKKLDDQRTDEQAKDDLIRENQRARELYGMTRWLEVKEAVKNYCNDFNVKADRKSVV